MAESPGTTMLRQHIAKARDGDSESMQVLRGVMVHAVLKAPDYVVVEVGRTMLRVAEDDAELFAAIMKGESDESA